MAALIVVMHSQGKCLLLETASRTVLSAASMTGAAAIRRFSGSGVVMGRIHSMCRFDLEAGKPDTPQEPINRERNYEPSSLPNSVPFESITSPLFDRTSKWSEAGYSRPGG